MDCELGDKFEEVGYAVIKSHVCGISPRKNVMAITPSGLHVVDPRLEREKKKILTKTPARLDVVVPGVQRDKLNNHYNSIGAGCGCSMGREGRLK